MYEQMLLEDWIYLIEDYALNLLKLSSDENDNKLLLEIKDALRTLGFILTEKGVMKNSSPLDRVLAYSKSKLSAVKEILKTEIEAIGDKIRVAIITDFEISNATSLKSVESIIDDECGGAISVIKELVSNSATDVLDPVMVTGNSLICDDDLAEEYIRLGLQWAREQLLDINLSLRTIEFDKFISVEGSGKDWSSRTAVLLTTYLFEAGVTKCIIGTRGLLGEGWDSLNLNTLIDLSVVTTYSSVNQLRGRSIRKSEADPRKISNNWDVICIAPDMEKGYNDLDRLYRKHSQFYGMCDDGQIQLGVNHVDPALTICDKKLGHLEVQSINKKMLNAASDREKAYDAWKIGEPFDNVELGCSEIKLLKPIKMKAGSVFVSERSILKNKILANVFKFSGTAASTSLAGIIATTMIPAAIPLLLFSGFLGVRTYLGIKDMWSYGKENFFSLSIKSSINDMARCTLNALVECELISPEIKEKDIVITERTDGTIRVYLNCKDKDSNIFSTALSQIFTPIESQRYAIQRFEVFVPESGLDKFIYLFRYGINKYSPLLACYHPIPDLFGIKEKALVFKKYWNKYVSPGDVVFLKGGKGQEILEKFGRINSLGAKKMNMKIWK